MLSLARARTSRSSIRLLRTSRSCANERIAKSIACCRIHSVSAAPTRRWRSRGSRLNLPQRRRGLGCAPDYCAQSFIGNELRRHLPWKPRAPALFALGPIERQVLDMERKRCDLDVHAPLLRAFPILKRTEGKRFDAP